MGPGEFKNLSGKALKVNNLVVEKGYISDEYRIEKDLAPTTETGHLEVLRLIRRDGKGPDFSARWDHLNDKVLKFDMCNASQSQKKKFRNGLSGYAGHHNEKSADPNKRVFEIKICARTEDIFIGTASLSLTFEMIMGEEAKAEATQDATPGQKSVIGDILAGEVIRAHDQN